MTHDPGTLADRMRVIQPFHVMAILSRARQLEAQGRSIVHMEVGEPDFDTPEPVVRAGIKALQEGKTHYTPAVGLQALREAISADYRTRFSIEVPAERILITPGASGALQLALSALVNPGDEVIMADPGYPCNRNFVYLVDGVPRSVPVTGESRYQLTETHLRNAWTDRTRAVLLASPSNPTGTMIEQQDLAGMLQFVHSRQASMIVDEIYNGLIYDRSPFTALSHSQDIFVINSFSKYFGMTGWRLGWVVAPESYVQSLDNLAQNIFLAASTPAQYAALAAFHPETLEILEQRKQAFQQRRDYLLPALRDLGFQIDGVPQGAFYLYANCSAFTDDAYDFSNRLLEEAGVAITPGLDFGEYRSKEHVRFAYTTSIRQLEEGVRRIREFLRQA